jgi:hypothetical protein
MRGLRLRWRVLLASGAGVLVLALPGAASAALLSDVLPGLVSPEGESPACDTSASQVFVPWSDSSYYVLMPGGAFEGDADWTLKNGARVVAGNESFFVHSARDRFSLFLPAGASATTPPMCFAFGDWHLRMFARDSGSDGRIRVTIIVRSLLGVVSVLDAGSFSPATGWRPSPKIGLLLTNIGGLLATDTIQLRLTASGGSAQLDDAYLDPWKNT